MSDNNRNWTKWDEFEVQKTIKNSKSTIELFEKSIENTQERNQESLNKIHEWEATLTVLKSEFLELNKITFEEATEYIKNSWNPENEFNLEQYNSIRVIEDKINGEKFFIYQREKLIYKNRKVINQIENRIKELQKEL